MVHILALYTATQPLLLDVAMEARQDNGTVWFRKLEQTPLVSLLYAEPVAPAASTPARQE
eukprot:scaffold127021_cov63-Phaeocystis_antarctica.AAC.3